MSFLVSVAEETRRHPKPELEWAYRFRLDNDKKVIDYRINQEESKNGNASKTVAMAPLQGVESRDFFMSYKCGYLWKKSKSMIKLSGSWVRRFYVLTNVGLLYMKNVDDKDVKLFPALDFAVEQVRHMTYNKARVFTLKTLRGQRFDMTL